MLKTPLTIGKLTLSNRLAMPPMATGFAADDGVVTSELVEYYREKSAGGHIGLVILEHSYISPEAKSRPGQLSASRDSDVEGLSRIAKAVHENGSAAVIQLNHGGAACRSEATGVQPQSPSGVGFMLKGVETEPSRPMTKDDIVKVVDDFASAAARAKMAGFDGCEIHSAHGYLLNQFYSPLTNKRLDEYGGDITGRIRIHLEVIRAVRKAVGNGFLVMLRLGACDYREGGNTIDDATAAAAAFVEAGVDILDISGGMGGYIRSDYSEPGFFSDASRAIKEMTNVPVMLTGGVTSAQEAEALLQAGVADIIGVGRAIKTDSSWAAQAMAESAE